MALQNTGVLESLIFLFQFFKIDKLKLVGLLVNRINIKMYSL